MRGRRWRNGSFLRVPSSLTIGSKKGYYFVEFTLCAEL
jgi:hypothetical protein